MLEPAAARLTHRHESDIAKIVARGPASRREGVLRRGQPAHEHGGDASLRLIGQEEAVVACSRAIRRARTGLKNPNRPSFHLPDPRASASPSSPSRSPSTLAPRMRWCASTCPSLWRGTPCPSSSALPRLRRLLRGWSAHRGCQAAPYTLVLLTRLRRRTRRLQHDASDSRGWPPYRLQGSRSTSRTPSSSSPPTSAPPSSRSGGGGLGFQLNDDAEDTSYQRIKQLVNEELKNYFRPEFLNRLDEIIVFRQLNKNEVREIAQIMLNQVFKRPRRRRSPPRHRQVQGPPRRRGLQPHLRCPLAAR